MNRLNGHLHKALVTEQLAGTQQNPSFIGLHEPTLSVRGKHFGNTLKLLPEGVNAKMAHIIDPINY